MKFQNDMDAQLFLIEIGHLVDAPKATKELKPTSEMIGLLKKKRQGLSRGLKSFRKSQASKATWRKFSAEIMRGIKAFHRSTEGKKFHRNLSRFLLRKEFTGFLTGKPLNMRNESFDFWEKADAIKAISSAKTHLFIELEYYHSLYEQMGLEELAINHLSDLSSLEERILTDGELNADDYALMGLLCQPIAMIKSLANESGKSIDDVEVIWKDSKQSLITEGHAEEDKNFFALLIGNSKKALKLD